MVISFFAGYNASSYGLLDQIHANQVHMHMWCALKELIWGVFDHELGPK